VTGQSILSEKAGVNLQQFRETSDGGVNWSKPKLTEIFDPPYPETLTPSRCDRKFYLASDAGVTRLGTIFSKEYLVTKMNKLDISQYVAASSLQLSGNLCVENKADRIGMLVTMTRLTTTRIPQIETSLRPTRSLSLELRLPRNSVNTP
jgi:hypothetical protein